MRIGFIGDTILSDEAKVGPGLLAVLQQTDFNIANLEAPFLPSYAKARSKAGLHNLTHRVDLLKQLNVKAVSLANNHMMDFGEKAIEYTINYLTKNNIGCFGAGIHSNNAYQSFDIKTKEDNFNFFGAMQRYHSKHHFSTQKRGGVAQYIPDLLTQRTNKSSNTKNILFLHWNQEFEDYPEPVSKSTAEKLTTHFDLIIGSHPHCPQGISVINHSVIAYSLGNFILPHRNYCNTALKGYPTKSYSSFIFIWNTDNKNNPYEVIPYTISKDGLEVEMPSDDESNQIRQHIQKLSQNLSIKGKAYRKFYLKTRIRRNRPILSENEFRNRIVIGSYMNGRALLLYIEILVAKILDAMGLRKTIKLILSKAIKRYH